MLPFALNRDSVIPLYYQIQQRLLEGINLGELKAGDPIPSEQEISEKLGVSRMTARQAVKSLCHRGVAYSLRGKGTFISSIKLEKNFRQVQSFTEEMGALGYRPSSKVLAFEAQPAPSEVAEALKLAVGEKIIRLRRLRMANSSPMGLECAHLPHRLCPGLLETFDPRTSLYQALWENHGIRVLVADEVVEAGLVGPKDARVLRVPSRSPVFLFNRTSYARDGQPVEFVKSIYCADRYKIVSRLTRMDWELPGPSAGRRTMIVD